MPAKPTKEVAARREREAARLRNRGWSQQRIADHLGVTPLGVRQILMRIDQRDLKSLPLEDIAMFKAEIDQRLCHVVEEAFDAWHQSKEPLRRVRRTTAAEGNEITVDELTEREGNVVYLDRVVEGSSQKTKL